jgi:hypothetical protein
MLLCARDPLTLMWQVDVALDGEQAVEMGTTGNYAVILM